MAVSAGRVCHSRSTPDRRCARWQGLKCNAALIRTLMHSRARGRRDDPPPTSLTAAALDLETPASKTRLLGRHGPTAAISAIGLDRDKKTGSRPFISAFRQHGFIALDGDRRRGGRHHTFGPRVRWCPRAFVQLQRGGRADACRRENGRGTNPISLPTAGLGQLFWATTTTPSRPAGPDCATGFAAEAHRVIDAGHRSDSRPRCGRRHSWPELFRTERSREGGFSSRQLNTDSCSAGRALGGAAVTRCCSCGTLLRFRARTFP